jgi:DNA-binding MarR family transcriptional regulator
MEIARNGNGLLLLQLPITSDFMTGIAHLIRLFKQSFSARSPVSIPQFSVLDLLERNGGSLPAKHISSSLGLKPSTVTLTIDSLEDAELVSRMRSRTSRREVNVALTTDAQPPIEEGRAVAKLVVQSIKEPLGRHLRGLMDEYTMSMLGQHALDNRSLDREGIGLCRLALYFEARLTNLLRAENLSPLEFRILFDLYEHSHKVPAYTLAKRLLVLPPDVTKACNRLEKIGLIDRCREGLDRRVVMVELTSRGFAATSHVAPLVDDLFYHLLGVDNFDERDKLLKISSLMADEARKSFRPN